MGKLLESSLVNLLTGLSEVAGGSVGLLVSILLLNNKEIRLSNWLQVITAFKLFVQFVTTALER